MALFGEQIQMEARRAIFTRHAGELLVGQADIVSAGHPDSPWLIVAPTMRVLMQLPSDTVNQPPGRPR
jgi:O-acetyl-ADP-ribose deacetylase (regulator of RNase III)